MWNLDLASQEADISAAMIKEYVAESCSSVLHCVQAIASSSVVIKPRLLVVTRNAMSTHFEEHVSVSQAPVWGLGRVAAIEHPDIWQGLVDLGSGPVADQMPALLNEIMMERDEDQVAIRGGNVYVARLVQCRPEPVRKFAIRPDGTYLITGGHGALAMKLAEWLVERGAKYLILSGRSQPSAAVLVIVEQLRAQGTEVCLFDADVSSLPEMTSLFTNAQRALPPIRGVVHAAGILDDGILARQNWERFENVLSPKVSGSWNLHLLTSGLSLDFFVLFSSASSLISSQGQGSYAAANAFLDSLAWIRRSRGLPALVVNWGPWKQQGMAAGLEARFKAFGIEQMPPDESLRALQVLMESHLTQAMVIRADWFTFGRRFAGTATPSITTGLVVPPPSTVAPAGPSQLRGYIVEEVRRVLSLDPSDVVDPQRGFSELGMDSLMAVELRNRFDASLSMGLPTTLVFEYPTVESLAVYLGGRLFPDGVQPAVAPSQVVQTAIAELRRQRTGELEEFIDHELRDLMQ